MRYEEHRDVYSCCPYVISAVAEMARTKTSVTKTTVKSCYGAYLTERDRWEYVEARLGNIFTTIIGNGLFQSAEFLVDENLLWERKQKYRSWIRRPIGEARSSKLPKLGRGKTKATQRQEDRLRIHVEPVKHKIRRVTFEDSHFVVSSIVRKLVDRVITSGGKTCRQCREGEFVRKVTAESKGRKPYIDGINRNEETEIIMDLPRKLSHFMSIRHFYGVHYCRSSLHNRKNYYLILHLRCLKYVTPWKCKTAVIGRLLANKRTWGVK